MGKIAYLKPVDIHGVASCIGAQNVRCYGAPLVLQGMGLNEKLQAAGWETEWSKTILVEGLLDNETDKYSLIGEICTELAQETAKSVSAGRFFITLGGDHSCAIGSWSGAASAMQDKGDIGLIWIDAHMDAHTPESSHSGAIHGMPVASLLGYGDNHLTEVLSSKPKVKPANLCLIGVRSYEPEEKALLDSLGVKVFYAHDVLHSGLAEIFEQAMQHVNKSSCAFGISLDMDAIDPAQAPGVGSPEYGGLEAGELLETFANLQLNDRFLGFELVELNSFEDQDDRTATLAIQLIEALLGKVN